MESIDKLIHHMLVANHLQRRSLLPLLTYTEKDIGCYHLQNEIRGSDSVFSEIDRSIHLYTPEEARERLFKQYPILKILSFQNYRLVGGSCLNGLRNHIDRGADLDFFPLISEMGDLIETEVKANAIYASFMFEIQHFYDTNQNDGWQITYLRNEDCTTIFIRQDDYSMLKIQFVHRIFRSEQQMIESADLFPSQILFDGNSFRCTYGALLSLKTNILPIDISRNSASFAHRIEKYHKQKLFILAFPGLDKFTVQQNLNRDKFSTPWGFNFKKKTNEIGAFSLVLDRVVGQREQAFYAFSPASNSKRLAKFNLLAYLKNAPISVFAHSAKEFLIAPKKTEIAKCFMKIMNLEGEASRNAFKFFFGATARDAYIAHFDQNEDFFSSLLETRVKELQEGIDKKFQSLERITWKTINPGKQTGDFLHPMSFYGALHNGYRIAVNTKTRITLLAVKRFRSSMLSRIPKDVLFLILDQMALENFEQEKLELGNLIQTKPGLPLPNFDLEDWQNDVEEWQDYDSWEDDF